MAKRTVTALYDRYEDATNAVQRLESLGVPHDDISIVANNESGSIAADRRHDDTHADTGAGTGATAGTLLGGGAGLLAGLGMLAIPGLGPVVAAGWLVSTLVGAGAGAALGGLTGSLVGAGVPEEHATAYAEGIRRGGTLVTARIEDSLVDRAVDILDDHGAVDMDEREGSWRTEGWNNASAGTGASLGTVAAAPAHPAISERTTDTHSSRLSDSTFSDTLSGASDTSLTGSADTLGGARAMATDTLTGADTGFDTLSGGRDKDVIPVVEEDLNVGKRDVRKGTVRVSSHVVETPVSEQVSLREETVHVERRPVDRAVSDADAALTERTIEAEERAEVPVVSKEARVTEEVVVSKDVERRTETVNDTVRKTEVDVEDDRSGRAATGTDRSV